MGKRQHTQPKGRKHNGKQQDGGRKKRKAMSTQELREMATELDRIGMELNDVNGDGNCFFRAIADQLEGDEHKHEKYRISTAEFIRTHKEDFVAFVEDDESFDEYVARISEDGEWGGQLEISAVSRLFNLDVVIHQLDLPSYEMQAPNRKNVAGKLHLYFHTENHYVSVRPKGSAKSTPAVNVQQVDRIIELNHQLAEAFAEQEKAKAKENQRAKHAAQINSDDDDDDCEDLYAAFAYCDENNANNNSNNTSQDKQGKAPKLSKRDKKLQKREEKAQKRQQQAKSRHTEEENNDNTKGKHKSKAKEKTKQKATRDPSPQPTGSARISTPILV